MSSPNSRLEALLQSVVANLNEGVVLVGSDKRIVLVNDRACEIVGIPRQELLGRKIDDGAFDFVDGEENRISGRDLPVCRTYDDGEPRRDQILGMGLPGSQRIWISLNCCVVQQGEDESARTLLLSFSDIGEKRRRERAMQDGLASYKHLVAERETQSKALAESESRLRMLIDTAPEAIVIFDVDEGRLVQVNRAAERMFGRDAEELLRMGPVELSPPLQPSGIPSAEGAAKVLREVLEGNTISFEWVYLGSAGTREILTEMNLSRMPSENKRLVRASIVDITRKRKTESIVETLVKATSSHYGQAFFDTLVRDICTLLEVEYAFVARSIENDTRMRTLSFHALGNPAVNFEYATSGSPCGDVLGKRPLVIRSSIQERYPQARELVDMEAQSYMGVPLFSTRHESLGVLAVVGTRPAEESELAEHILTIFGARAQLEIERLEAEQALRTLNIELEKRVRERTEELQASNRELESFAYSVSHDLRSPLRTIDGFGQALEEDCAPLLDEQGREYVDRIRRASRRMADLIDDLLSLSRSSRGVLEKSDIDLSSIAREIVSNLRTSDPDRAVEVDIDPDLHARADPVLMRAVLGNLLENSWKYTRKTGHPVISFRSEPAQEGFARFAVSDNGAGFDPAHAGKLFGTFQRLHSAEEFEGNGIGLATAHRIIERHGGSITGSGEVGKGATFRFELPV